MLLRRKTIMKLKIVIDMDEQKETGPDEIIFQNVVSILKEGQYPFVLLMATDTRLERMQGFHAANGGDGIIRTAMIQRAIGLSGPIFFKAEQLARQTEAWGAGHNQTGLVRWIPNASEPAEMEVVDANSSIIENGANMKKPIAPETMSSSGSASNASVAYMEGEPSHGPDFVDEANVQSDSYEQEQETLEGVEGDYDLSEYEESYDNYDDYQE